MHKNPFLPNPTSSYTQPPLPPGPPPGAPPVQQDYSATAAYWAAQQGAPPPPPPHNYAPQWAPQQPPRPPPVPAEQTHLYANYGYGPHWQRQNQPAHPPPQPPPPPPPQYQQPPPQPPYNPYQPAAGYGQQYPPPHVGPPPLGYGQPPPPGVPTSQPYYGPPGVGPPPGARLHHSPPQTMPPAKRQRFDSGPAQQRQPQFQQHASGGSRGGGGGGGGNMGNRSNNPGNRGNGGGSGGGGGGMAGNRGGGRAGGGQNRGGAPNKGARGGGSFSGAGRGGASGANPGMRGHGSRNNMANNNRRGGGGGGSFTARGRGQKGALGGGVTFGRHGVMNSSFTSMGGSKKDENRRTLTDFKITTLEIPELGWEWGVPQAETTVVPVDLGPDVSIPEVKKESDDGPETVSSQVDTDGDPDPSSTQDDASAASLPSGSKPLARTDTVILKDGKDGIPPPRMRIYFHTPVSPDDSHPMAGSEHVSDSRKGKRKKLELDDDNDSIEDDRAPPPPPQPYDDRSSAGASVAPSVASEGDWLMASLAAVTPSVQGDDPEEYEGSHSAGDPEEGNEFEQAHVKTEDEGDPPLHEDLFATKSDIGPSGIPFPSQNDSNAEGGESSPVDRNANEPSESGHADSPPPTQQTVDASQSAVSTLFDITQPEDSNQDHEKHDDDDREDSPSVKTEPASPPAQFDLPLPVFGPILPEHATKKVPSANRLSISYAGGNRRLVIDSDVVDAVKIFRQDGRIEIALTLSKDGDEDVKGILVENLSDVTKSYSALHAITNVSYETDPTFPPFSRLEAYPASLTLLVKLDTVRPLSEPKWVKSGDIHEWLKSIFGRMFWVAGDAAQGWEKKITVVDPDPAPTIRTVLDGWAINSPVGTKSDRERFLKTHMDDPDNVMEILLRLVRGERATPFSTSSNSSLSLANLSGPLLTALKPASSHSGQQTHVSLAVLAMFQMAVDFAKETRNERATKDVQDKMGEIIRCLPSHLLYKSLDGIFKEWRVDKKGGR